MYHERAIALLEYIKVSVLLGYGGQEMAVTVKLVRNIHRNCSY